MKKIFILTAFLCLAQLSFAQEFLIKAKSITGDAQVQTIDGRTINGKIISFDTESDLITKIKVKDSITGESTKLKAEEIKTVRIKMDLNRKAETLEKQVKSISLTTLNNAKSDEAFNRDYVYYNQVSYPEKKDRIYLSELLNPDFSSKIQVYEGEANSGGSTSVMGLSLVPNKAQSYIIVINGVSSFVRKKKYKTDYFDKIFAGCPELMAMPEKEVSFFDLAKHVSIFEKCK